MRSHCILARFFLFFERRFKVDHHTELKQAMSQFGVEPGLKMVVQNVEPAPSKTWGPKLPIFGEGGS